VAITTFTQQQVTDGAIQFVHDGGEIAPTYSVTVSDGALTDGPLAATITFTNVNDAPTIDLDADDSGGSVGSGFDSSFFGGGGPVAIVDVDATLSDLDSSDLVGLTVTITNLVDSGAEWLAADTTGTAITASYDAASGVLTLSGTDSLANYEQVLRSVTYDNTASPPDASTRVIAFVADDGLDIGGVAEARVAVTAINVAPTASADAGGVAEGGSVVLDLAANDTDPENSLDPASIEIVSGPLNGSLVVNGDGSVRYQHDGSETSADGFRYTIRDTQGAVSNVQDVTLSVTPVNDAPSGAADAFSVSEDQTLVVGSASGVLANDADAENDGLTATLVTQPSRAASFSFNVDGSFSYLPAADFTGSDQFSYVVSDGSALSSVTAVTLSVLPVNDAPTLEANTGSGVITGLADSVTSSELQAADVDDAASDLTFTVTRAPTSGHLELSTAPGAVATTFTQEDITASRLSYVLDTAATSDSFDFVVADASGAVVGEASFALQVASMPAAIPIESEEPPSSEATEEADLAPIVAEAAPEPAGGDSEELEPAAGEPPAPRVILETRTELRLGVPIETAASAQPQERGPRERDLAAVAGDRRDGAFRAVEFEGRSLAPLQLQQTVDVALGQAREELERDSSARASEFAVWVARSESVMMAVGLGLVASLLRSGSLLALTVSSMPVWKGLDPVAVLMTDRQSLERRASELRFAERIEDETDGVGRVLDDDEARSPSPA
jgi:hypothetical protein